MVKLNVKLAAIAVDFTVDKVEQPALAGSRSHGLVGVVGERHTVAVMSFISRNVPIANGR